MSWRVIVRDPTGTSISNEFLNGARVSDGLVALRKFDPAIVHPPGMSKNLNLYGRQDRMQIVPRCIVQLLLDEVPVFYGPAIITPPDFTKGSGPYDRDRDSIERVTVTGGEQLLKDSVIGCKMFQSNVDVASIAYQLCDLYSRPGLSIDPLDFPDTGAMLSLFYMPEHTLYDALAKLTESVPGGASFWVDATGAIHFEAN